MKNQTIVHSDTYYIAQRLKEIDNSYYIVFNFDKGKFEIHSSNQTGDSYCLTVPYPILDERVLELVRKTSSKNLDNVIDQMEQENQEMENKRIKETVEILKEVIHES